MAFIPVKTTGTWEDWGKLVLSWANAPNTMPGQAFEDNSVKRVTFADGQARTLGGAAGVTFPDSVREVIFVRDTSERRYVRLPDPVMAKAAQNDMQGSAAYNLPKFYFDPPLNCQKPENVAQKLKLQAERVGDYSIGSCM